MTLPLFVPLSPDEATLQSWPTDVIDHVSVSNLIRAMRCPEQYRRHYIKGLREPRSGAMLIGSAGDVAHEANFRQKIDTRRNMPLPDVLGVAAEAFDAEVAEAGLAEIEWDGDPRSIKGRKAAAGKALDVAVACTESYYVARAQFVQPRAVEAPFELELPGIPVPLVGRIDVIATPRRIIERKTLGRRDFRGDHRFQMQVYQLAKPGHRAELDVVVKNKQPVTEVAYGIVRAPDPAEQARIRRLAAGTMATIASLLDRYGPDEAWPTGALTHTWACDLCGWGPKGTRACEWWKGAKTERLGPVAERKAKTSA